MWPRVTVGDDVQIGPYVQLLTAARRWSPGRGATSRGRRADRPRRRRAAGGGADRLPRRDYRRRRSGRAPVERSPPTFPADVVAVAARVDFGELRRGGVRVGVRHRPAGSAQLVDTTLRQFRGREGLKQKADRHDSRSQVDDLRSARPPGSVPRQMAMPSTSSWILNDDGYIAPWSFVHVHLRAGQRHFSRSLALSRRAFVRTTMLKITFSRMTSEDGLGNFA